MATIARLTGATQRKPTSSSSTPTPSTKSQQPQQPQQQQPTRYSHRRAASYKPSDLPQFTVPNFTIKDLLSAIPSHCFERNALHSFAYVFGDLALVALLAWGASHIDGFTASIASGAYKGVVPTDTVSVAAQASAAGWALWTLYSIAQGIVFTGLWVLAHECGHQAFSTSKTLNNAVGWVLHSALLVPYHSWRISHARHHAATGHLTRDEVFVPRTRAQKGLLPLKPAMKSKQEEEEEEQVLDAVALPSSTTSAPSSVSSSEDASNTVVQAPEYVSDEKESWGEWLAEVLEDAPLFNLVFVVAQQLFGWPLYLIQNSSGQLHYPAGTNHFDPKSVIFDTRHRMQVLMSDVGIALTFSALYAWSLSAPQGWFDVLRYYLIPYLWCNHWLVMITCLQHTDVALPHYTADEWTFPRGALCTIDRSWLWPVGPYLFHGIAETHVLHHISSKIPHYHAWEATAALKERLGEHYKYSDENVFLSLWKNVRSCKFIDEQDKVAFYRNAHGVPTAVVSRKQGHGKEESGNEDSGVALSD